jgi:RNA polymerase sigma-70 factor, ECF subfamily
VDPAVTAVERIRAGIDGVLEDAPMPTPVDFETFFLKEHVRLFRALCLLTKNRQEAEEVMQDAFLKLWERWGRTSAMENPTGYLYRTAMNLYRSRSRRALLAVRRTVRPEPADDALAALEDREVVIRALAPLTPRQRAAVVLMDILDLSSEEAGAALGVRASTVRVLVARGRARLREAMGDRDE